MYACMHSYIRLNPPSAGTPLYLQLLFLTWLWQRSVKHPHIIRALDFFTTSVSAIMVVALDIRLLARTALAMHRGGRLRILGARSLEQPDPASPHETVSLQSLIGGIACTWNLVCQMQHRRWSFSRAAAWRKTRHVLSAAKARHESAARITPVGLAKCLPAIEVSKK